MLTITLSEADRDAILRMAADDMREHGRLVGDCTMSSRRYADAHRWYWMLCDMAGAGDRDVAASRRLWGAAVRWLDLEVDDCVQASRMALDLSDRTLHDEAAGSLASTRIRIQQALEDRLAPTP